MSPKHSNYDVQYCVQKQIKILKTEENVLWNAMCFVLQVGYFPFSATKGKYKHKQHQR